MRHQSENIFVLVANAGNRIDRTVWIADFTVLITVVKQYLVIFIKFFKPFWINIKVAVMMGLILRFVPVIFDQAKETLEAQRARCVQNRKNPVYRLIKLGFPLMRRTFERADDLVAAMEARGFTENRTDPELVSHQRDWVALLILSGLCITVIIL